VLDFLAQYIDFTVLKTKFFTDEGQGSIFKLRECVQSIFCIKIIQEESFLQKFAKNFFRDLVLKVIPLKNSNFFPESRAFL
jgi:hypothetical protein